VLLLLIGCVSNGDLSVSLTTYVASEAATLEAWASTLGDPRVGVDDRLIPPPGGYRVELIEGEMCAECFRVTVDRRQITVEGGGPLGRLYGAAHALEQLGWRFHHPLDTFQPDRPRLAESPEGFDVVQEPEVAHRGLHLHTLHPIEGLRDLWMSEEGGNARAAAIVDWVVRQRGNHLQWVALDDISRSPSALAAWRLHTTEVVEAAHARGITVGLGIQLFGSGNLQQAFDLLDEVGEPAEQAAAMDSRLAALSGLGIDAIDLSFGEFFAEEPEKFIASAELAYDRIQAALPGARVSSVIHVGDDLQVTWEGETFPYYFLATRLDRPVVPHIHTVMYYNLFEDAGGAYHHDDFDDHRTWLEDALTRGTPAGYFPESAYWIAFDDSVPNYFPLYLRSRWHDLDQIAERTQGGLADHVLFSSGWEWGYWQTDMSVLRQLWRLEEDPWAPLRRELTPYGEAGATLADAVAALGDVQHTRLLEGRLTPYIASYDNVMELGFGIGKVAQPQRMLPRELVALDPAAATAFRAQVSDPLGLYAAEVNTIAAPLRGLDGADEHRALREIVDGIELAGARASFALDLLGALDAANAGQDPQPRLASAEVHLDDAREIVARRHADLHDPQGERLLTPFDNPTIYDFGYLYRADRLCFWVRELGQVREAVGEEVGVIPGCSLEVDPP
jgi:hypothetical protein